MIKRVSVEQKNAISNILTIFMFQFLNLNLYFINTKK